MKPILALADFRNRERLGEFLNKRGLTGQGVEIGTHRGEFAVLLLKRWKGSLHCVDPWATPAGYEKQAESLKQLYGYDGNRDTDFSLCVKRLQQYSQRVKFHRSTSEEAAEKFASGSLDFVYLDGDHRGLVVLQDLNLWYPKLKPGGILAGHDFLCIGEPNGGWGREVQNAVLPFAGMRGLTVWMVMEEDNSPWSFYLEKPDAL